MVDELVATLASLPVRVDDVQFDSREVSVADYPPDDRRPTTTLRLSGLGQHGFGELIAWTQPEHRVFADAFAGYRHDGLVSVGVPAGSAYARFAFECALIDLALRQNGLGWSGLTGLGSTALNTWVSFDRTRDPARRASTMGRHRFKIDVHPDWSDAEIEALAAHDVGVLDFKHAPDPELCRRCRRVFPHVLFEDPPLAEGPRARDQVVLAPEDAEVPPGERVNLKGPRMGGLFALLDALGRCRARGTAVYFGGMFELSVGREIARTLAATFAPDGWHDLALLPVETGDPRGPVVVEPVEVGLTNG